MINMKHEHGAIYLTLFFWRLESRSINISIGIRISICAKFFRDLNIDMNFRNGPHVDQLAFTGFTAF